MIRSFAILCRLSAVLVMLCATAAAAFAAGPTVSTQPVTDGRLYGHIAYAQADPTALVDAPPGFAVGQECKVQRAMIPDLVRLIAAEHGARLGADIRGVSCFRTIDHQQRLFCESHGRKGNCADPQLRAISVAPPGHSEHATGYAIDFGVRPERGCADVENCFADTAVGQWLIVNAPDYGFELSFPKNNPQGVTWEPWHWRWVGTSNSEAGALAARALFADARAHFPADPRIPTIMVRVVGQPPLPTTNAEEDQPLLASAPQGQGTLP